ncbi:hypothetical protein [Acetomicrobium sp.]|uniref:hypothetical protein n=1 Tax=Acetomicrobium sp. TaxID=1872099 RepID=UPI002FC8CF9D
MADDDCVVSQTQDGGMHYAIQHTLRFGKVIEVMRGTPAICDGKSRIPASPPCPSPTRCA